MPDTTPPNSTSVNPCNKSGRAGDTPYVLGIDIGGTKIGIGVVCEDGHMLASDRIPTQVADGPEVGMRRIIDLSRRLLDKAHLTPADLTGIGVGSPGPLDTKAGHIVRPANLHTWVDVPIGPRLTEAFGCPTVLENDANAAVVGEYRFGAGRGIANLVYITISTGIGAGVIVDNRLMRGENGNAAEIGHISVAWNGRKCPCGNIGCVEAYSSGTGIAARTREAITARTPAALKSSLAKLPGGLDAVTGESVVEALRHLDPLALEIWQETIQILAAALVSVIHTFNPRRIVIGGGLANAGDLLFPPLRKAIGAHAIHSLAAVCDIVPAELGGSVGVLGAAGVAYEMLGMERGPAEKAGVS